jgi:SAM-dependent methyltransferase
VGVDTAREQGNRAAEIAYEAMAFAYDDFTAEHDYEAWLGALLPQLGLEGLRGERLLDVACGTGKSFIPMLERGWEVTACDISAAMVELARVKVGDAAKLSVADMRELPKLGEFDLVWCLDDAVNYLLDADELERALSGMRRNLGPAGLLMFDVNTLLAYRTFFAEEVEVERNGRRLLWKGRATADTEPGATVESSFEVEGAPGPPAVHRQRHFPEAEMLATLERAGLECLQLFGHGSSLKVRLEQPLDEARHSKAVYICRAAG